MTTHPDSSLLATFLAGDLPPERAAAVDAHLIECSGCWRAAQDSTTGRLAAEALREVAPPVVRDRVLLAVSLAPAAPTPSAAATAAATGARRRRAGALLVSCTVAAAFVLFALARPGPPAPDSFAGIVRQVRASANPHALPSRVEIGGRALRLEQYELGRGRVVVALGSEPFPMPASAHPTRGGIDAPWSATIDDTPVMCINEPRPVLLVGDRSTTVGDLGALAARFSPA